jgi:transcriptional regulator with XRE-family HTH domain
MGKDGPEILSRLGENIKSLRVARNINLEELAKKAGLSASFISQLERGKGNPSFLSLSKLAQSLEISIIELMNMDDFSSAQLVCPKERRRIITPARGVVNESITPEKLFGFDALIAQYEPNTSDLEPYSHKGGETIFVIEGSYDFHYGSRTYHLEEGCAINFRGEKSHWGENKGDRLTRLMIIIA